MPALLTREGLHFLYRSEAGAIDCRTWWLGTVLLASILLVLTLVWLALLPWAGRGLDERALIDGRTVVAYIYLAFYVFALFLIAVSYLNLSAKRFRARGFRASRPLALAGAPLLALLLYGAVVWLQKRVVDVVPDYLAPIAAIICAAAFCWHVFELGLRSGGEKS